MSAPIVEQPLEDFNRTLIVSGTRQGKSSRRGPVLSWRWEGARVASWGDPGREGKALSGERTKGTPRCPGWNGMQMVEPFFGSSN